MAEEGFAVAESEYTLLLFGWDDTVLGVETVVTADPGTARRTAETLLERDYPTAAGWQLWQAGQKVMSTFPQNRGDRRARLQLVAGNSPAN